MPGGLPAGGGSPSTGATAVEPVPQLDPEQLRQFQQFQQFQDFLRYTQAQRQGNGQVVPAQNAPVQSAPGYGPPTQPGHGGPPIPPPPYGQLQPPQPPPPRPKIKAPRWAKRLAGKLLSAFLFLLVLVIAGTLAYRHFFPNTNNDDLPAAITGGGSYHTNHILSLDPYEAVRTVYDAIAQGLVPQGCGRFREDIQQKFATDYGFPDCQQAVLGLHGQVTNMNGYAESIPSSLSEPLPGDTITVDSCRFAIEGGPALGVFTVQRVEKGQWLITGHEPGPRVCSGAPSTPTSR